MLDRKRTISPIIGSNIKMTRQARVLLDVDHVELGTPGITSILGHNGAGKSLLLKILTGLVKPDQGSVLWNGAAPSRSNYSQLGYMKQNAVLLRRSAKANLEYVLQNSGLSKQEASQKALAALENAGLGAIANNSARVLSGGERQRLSLVRTLVVEPQVILLDEPTASLDPHSRAQIEQSILELKQAGKSVTLVTHDLAQASRLSDDILFLDQARILPRIASTEFFEASHDAAIRNFLSS